MIKRAVGIVASMLCAVVASGVLTPRKDMVLPGEVRLAALVPKEFGDWRESPNVLAQVDVAVRRDGALEVLNVYDEVVSRSYRNSSGQVVMLSIAYGRRQRQEVKIHRPELCYAAQGFTVTPLPRLSQALSGRSAPMLLQSMVADAPGRIEPVVYWVRVGDTNSISALRTRLYIMKEGLLGRVVDGVLVRTSQIIPSRTETGASLVTQQEFIEALIHSLEPEAVRRLVSSS